MKNRRSVVRLGLIQSRSTANPAMNLRTTLALAGQAAKQGAHIICTQELFRSTYFCQQENPANFQLAEPIPGPTTRAFASFAKRHQTVVIASLFERRAPGVYHNTAVVLDADGTLLGRYRKMHIPDDPRYYEKFYFTPGDLGFRTWSTRYAKLGVLICWDQWFPEAARLTALQGAEILFCPTAIGWHPAEKVRLGQQQHAAWEIIQRSHAVSNGVFVAVPNRVGLEQTPGSEGLEFWGQSFVAGTGGQVLARASSSEDEVLVVPVDLSEVDKTRTQWPFLRDRRIDAYGELTRRLID